MNLVQKETTIHGTPQRNFAVYCHPECAPKIPLHTEYYLLPHWHPEYEFTYALKEPVDYIINGITYSIQPGELFFINKNLIHSSKTFPRQPTSYYSIVFGEQFVFPSVMDNLYQSYILPMHQQHKCLPTVFTRGTKAGAEIIRHVDEFLQVYLKKESGYELNLRSHLLAIWGIAIGENLLVEDSSFRENPSTFLVHNALSIIHENYMNPITIQKLASDLGITHEYFCRIFKAAIGKRPLEYITLYRIRNSLTYLSQTQDSVTSIASRCGFDDINYFSRCFKKIQGMTPTEYRKNIYKNAETF